MPEKMGLNLAFCLAFSEKNAANFAVFAAMSVCEMWVYIFRMVLKSDHPPIAIATSSGICKCTASDANECRRPCTPTSGTPALRQTRLTAQNRPCCEKSHTLPLLSSTASSASCSCPMKIGTYRCDASVLFVALRTIFPSSSRTTAPDTRMRSFFRSTLRHSRAKISAIRSEDNASRAAISHDSPRKASQKARI